MFNSKKIVDERQERQSQKNGNITYIVIISMLCIFYVYQTLFQHLNLDETWPEFVTLMAACILKTVLDARQGIVYTKMNSKTKLTAALYVSAALIFAVVVGVSNYLLYGFAPWMIVIVVLPLFFGMLVLFLIAHFAYLKAAKKRLEKLERELDEEEFRK